MGGSWIYKSSGGKEMCDVGALNMVRAGQSILCVRGKERRLEDLPGEVRDDNLCRRRDMADDGWWRSNQQILYVGR